MNESELPLSKTLVLNVDRDGDVEIKSSRKTPLIGKQQVLEAAESLLLADPEEADGNAMYAAVKIFNQIKGVEGRDKQVAVISGLEGGGLEADRKITRELKAVLSSYPADNVVLVTDGFSDEQIIPIVSSYVKISSIQRIVVKHSKSVEETYALLARYLKMVWEQPPYRIYFVGVPGIALVIIGVLLALNLLQLALQLILVVIGGAFVVKGFGIGDYITTLRHAQPIELLKLFSTAASIIFIISGVYISYLGVSSLPEFTAVSSNPQLIFIHGVYLSGVFLDTLLPIFVAAILTYIIGISLYNVFTEAKRLVKNLTLAVSTIVFYFVGKELAAILINPLKGVSTLITYILVGVSIIFIVSASSYILLRKKG